MTKETHIFIKQLIGLADQRINQQVNSIIHHPCFQALESGWRGLWMVVAAAQKNKKRVKVRVLQFTLAEISKDVTHAAEPEQSQLFRKIYIETLDQAGGEPFGILIGDYYVSYQRTHEIGDGIECLQRIAHIAAEAFVPFITSVSPHFFGLDSFSELQGPLQFDTLFQAPEYHRWHRLRQDEASHFLMLTLPRIIFREPYNADSIFMQQRFFKEEMTCHDDYLWGNACYVYAIKIINCFIATGWFTGIRGVNPEESEEEQALLPRLYFKADRLKTVPRITTECLITDRVEKQLSDSGLVAAKDHPYTGKLHFYSSQTVKLAKTFKREADSTSARINTMLHYVLCMCRFAHYIKVIIRNKIGSFTTAEECERFINSWLNQYCSDPNSESLETIIKRPLADVKVTIHEVHNAPGKFYCSMLISPHSQFDDIQSQLRLVTQVRIK